MDHAQTADYVLGHSGHELNRLIEQARFFGDLTAELLRVAGIGPGMHVLDVGCGAGDVSFLAASLVGPTGTVLGVDKSSEAVQLAEQRAAAAGLKNVSFAARDLEDARWEGGFDAVIGRLVLMYFPEPAQALHRLAAAARPGGIVAFHEFDLEAATSEPSCEIYNTALRRLCDTFARAGIDARTGVKLARIFEDAGLPAPKLIAHARAEYGPDSSAPEQVTRITQTLLPLMERTGVATAAEVDIATLTARVRDESTSRRATLFAPLFVGAWVRKPG